MNVSRLLLLITLSTLLLACGSDKKKEEKSDAIKIGGQKEVEPKKQSENELTITGNDMMQYNKKELRVKTGTQVTLTLTHIGKMGKQVMGHNVVILKPGVDINEFALKAVEAGEAEDWIPDGGKDVIAHTKMLGGGESVTINFNAPKAGTYDFICSFPGHSALMRGKFIVE
jgi:azurin